MEVPITGLGFDWRRLAPEEFALCRGEDVLFSKRWGDVGPWAKPARIKAARSGGEFEIDEGVGVLAVALSVGGSSLERLSLTVWAREASVVGGLKVGIGSLEWMSGFEWVVVDNCG